jgi:hypothetical protein
VRSPCSALRPRVDKWVIREDRGTYLARRCNVRCLLHIDIPGSRSRALARARTQHQRRTTRTHYVFIVLVPYTCTRGYVVAAAVPPRLSLANSENRIPRSATITGPRRSFVFSSATYLWTFSRHLSLRARALSSLFDSIELHSGRGINREKTSSSASGPQTHSSLIAVFICFFRSREVVLFIAITNIKDIVLYFCPSTLNCLRRLLFEEDGERCQLTDSTHFHQLIS